MGSHMKNFISIRRITFFEREKAHMTRIYLHAFVNDVILIPPYKFKESNNTTVLHTLFSRLILVLFANGVCRELPAKL